MQHEEQFTLLREAFAKKVVFKNEHLSVIQPEMIACVTYAVSSAFLRIVALGDSHGPELDPAAL